MTVMGASERRPIRSLLEEDRSDHIKKYKHLVENSSSYPVILNGDTLISLPPLVNCEETKISDETEDILVEVTTDHSEKSVHIERVKLVLPESPEKLFPAKLPDFSKK